MVSGCQDWAGAHSATRSSILTPTRREATILYRLVGRTMGHSGSGRYWFMRRQWELLPIESMPIPYSLTDFGRAYLESLRIEEIAGETADPLLITTGVGARDSAVNGLPGIED